MKNQIYEDSDYIIIAKDAEIKGSLMAPIDIIRIGVSGLPTVSNHFKNKEDYNKMIDDIKEDLEKQKMEKNEY